MTTTISNISQEITQIISNSKSIPSKITEDEKINRFLDAINSLRTSLVERTEKIRKLDELFSQLTWYDLQNQEEEDLLESVIARALSFHSKSIKNFVSLRKSFSKDKICNNEISGYKSALDDFEESIYEVKEIFFNLRKDEEFNNLMNSL